MSDEDIIIELENESDPVIPPPIRYCSVEDVINLFGVNVSDTIETDLVETAIDNSTGWIHGRLRKYRVPLPYLNNTGVSSTIKTIATYYSASDCYGALFNGDDYQNRFDMWFIKAKELLEDYIEAYWNTCADTTEQTRHQIVAHRHTPSYYQKRHRRRY